MIGLAGAIVTRSIVIVAVVVGGCQFNGRPLPGENDGPPAADGPFDSRPADARIDATPGDPCLDWQFTPAEFDPCALSPPSPGQIAITSGVWTLDGDAGTLSSGSPIAISHMTLNNITVFSVEDLTIAAGAELRVVGDDPVAIAVWGDATISGTINLTSDYNDHGAGANSPNCAGGPNAPEIGGDQNSGDGGSGGGGFNGDGGAGSDGNGGSGNGDGGAGGKGRGVPTRVDGGCPGAPAQSGTSGYAGAGGGGIAIIVKGSLLVTGTITAGGDGGGGATGGGQEAGGGGGSGGMIKLEAQALTVSAAATLAANGGQGGGGNNNNDASPGEDGQPDDSQALVSNKEGGGGVGGGGGYVADINGGNAAPNPSNDGGGGGGGAAGYIVYRGHNLQSVDLAATISPAGQSF